MLKTRIDSNIKEEEILDKANKTSLSESSLMLRKSTVLSYTKWRKMFKN